MKRQNLFKKPILIGLVLVSLAFLTAMAGRPDPAANRNQEESIKGFLSSIETSYSIKDFGSIISLLDRDFQGPGDFKESLQNEFLNKKGLDLKFIFDSSLQDGDTTLVRLHWFKKYSDFAGKLFKQKGESQFALHQTPDGLKLLYIRGDNPFY